MTEEAVLSKKSSSSAAAAEEEEEEEEDVDVNNNNNNNNNNKSKKDDEFYESKQHHKRTASGAADVITKMTKRAEEAVIKTANNLGENMQKTRQKMKEKAAKSSIGGGGGGGGPSSGTAKNNNNNKKKSKMGGGTSSEDNNDRNKKSDEHNDNNTSEWSVEQDDESQSIPLKEQKNSTTTSHSKSTSTSNAANARSNANTNTAATTRTATTTTATTRTAFKSDVGDDKEDLIRNPAVQIIVALAIIAKFVSIWNYKIIWYDRQVPSSVFFLWILISALVGKEYGHQQAIKEIEKAMERMEQEKESAATTTASSSSCTDTTIDPDRVSSEQQQKGEKNKIHISGFRRIKAMMEKMRHSNNSNNTNSNNNNNILRSWTSLNRKDSASRKLLPWERFGSGGGGGGGGSNHVLVSKSLNKALFGKVPQKQRTSLRDLGVSEKELQQAMEEDEALLLGSYVEEPDRLRATSLEEEVVNPLCRLRGMDAFLTDTAETSIATHSFLIDNGLRDRPTLVINGITQWANICIYFELPTWIKDWDDIAEKDGDPEDVIALKRFLNGDDTYRNKRLKVIALLVDGPLPVKFVAPTDLSAATVVTERVPGKWIKHDPTITTTTTVGGGGGDNDKTILHPCLEFECDLMANGAIRSICSLLKRYLRTIVADCAILIEKPYGQEEDEPMACLGLCRFNRVDVRECPVLPPRFEEGKTQEERDITRASTLLGVPPPETSLISAHT